MSYCLLDFPIHLAGCVNTHRTFQKVQTCSSVCNSRPSSVLQQNNEGAGNNLNERRSYQLYSFSSSGIGSISPVFSLPNTVGILGSVSAISTVNFIEKLVKWSSRDGQESLPFVAYNDPVLNRELSSCGRNSFPYITSRNSACQFNKTLIIDNLKQKRLFLEKSGARCIVMPCHLSHVWFDEVYEGCSLPFCHLGEAVAKELKAANLKPIEAGSNLRIGVLASQAILSAGAYQEQLRNQGFEVVLPDKAMMDHVVNPAIEAFERKDMEGASNLLRIALQALLVRAVNTVIIASEEMIGLLPNDDPLLSKCTNPMDALVRSTIQWAVTAEDGMV